MVSLGVGSVFASFRLGGGGNLSKADRFDPTTLDSFKGLSSPSTGSDGVLVESFVRLVKQVGVVFRCFAECSCCSLSDMASERMLAGAKNSIDSGYFLSAANESKSGTQYCAFDAICHALSRKCVAYERIFCSLLLYVGTSPERNLCSLSG